MRGPALSAPVRAVETPGAPATLVCMFMSKSGRGRLEPHAVVVGGGISGLAAAHWLQEHRSGLTVTVVEESPRLGGKILTEHLSGFVVEGGPDSFLASKPHGIELCHDLGLDAQLVGTQDEHRRTYVMKDGTLHRMPDGLTGLVPSRLEPLLQSDLFSARGKERLEQELTLPPAQVDGEESVSAFIRRRFGREVYDRMIEPLMAGIYAGDGDQLSLDATFPQLRRLEREFGSVIAGVRGAAASTTRSEGDTPLFGFLTPRTGMGEIVTRLRGRLQQVRIITGSRAVSLRRTRNGYDVGLDDGSILPATAVVLAVPADAAAVIVDREDPDLGDLLAGVRHVSTATISMAFRKSELGLLPDGFGYVVPRREGRAVLACTWTSNKFPNRAPPSHFLARAFVGRAGAEDVLQGTDQDLVDVARREMREIAGIESAPLFTRVFRWPDGMPQYGIGHLDRLAAIEARLARHEGLALAGNAYRGVGIPDCIRSAQDAAHRITASASR